MDRREWIKNTSLASGAVILPDFGINKFFAGANETGKNGIEEIHLINLSHTDFGQKLRFYIRGRKSACKN